MLSVKCSTAGSAILPPGTILRPTCISPLRNVPAVMITAFAWSSTPHIVRTPMTFFRGVEHVSEPLDDVESPEPLTSSTSSSSAWSCQMSRFGVLSSIERHCQMNFPRSHCARGLHMAGPFERFSMRNCIAVASVTSPIIPPKASTSRTICPFAMPPTAGLQLICAILFMSIVTRHVLAPMLALAHAASHPAWPPPMTITSYFRIINIQILCRAKLLKVF